MNPGSGVGSILGLAKGVSPWVGLVAVAFYIGSDHATVIGRLDALARADTTNIALWRSDLRELRQQVESTAVRELRHFCFDHRQSSECVR